MFDHMCSIQPAVQRKGQLLYNMETTEMWHLEGIPDDPPSNNTTVGIHDIGHVEM